MACCLVGGKWFSEKMRTYRHLDPSRSFSEKFESKYTCFNSTKLNWKCRLQSSSQILSCVIITSSNWNIFRVTGPLWWETTGHRRIPLTKVSGMELWCFFFICAWTNGWENRRDAGDLRRHHIHYDVSVMFSKKSTKEFTAANYHWLSLKVNVNQTQWDAIVTNQIHSKGMFEKEMSPGSNQNQCYTKE